MMHKAWSSIEEVPYCFSRSSVKFQGHTALKIVQFDPNWAFPDCNSSLNSPMAMKCYTKLETAKERCPIVFHGHPSNFKVTRDKTSPILTQIGRFRTIGQSQLSNPSDLPCSCKEILLKMSSAKMADILSRERWVNMIMLKFSCDIWLENNHVLAQWVWDEHQYTDDMIFTLCLIIKCKTYYRKEFDSFTVLSKLLCHHTQIGDQIEVYCDALIRYLLCIVYVFHCRGYCCRGAQWE